MFSIDLFNENIPGEMQCMSPACKQDAIVCGRHNCGKIDIYRATALARATHLRKGSQIKEAGRRSGNEENTHHHYYHCCGIACHRPKVGSKSIHAISRLSFTSMYFITTLSFIDFLIRGAIVQASDQACSFPIHTPERPAWAKCARKPLQKQTLWHSSQIS